MIHNDILNSAKFTKDMSNAESSIQTGETPVAHDPCKPRKLPVMFQMLINPRFQVALGVSIVRDIMILALDSVLALFVQSTFGWNTTAAGLCFIPVSEAFVFGPLVGRLIDRVGTRWPAAFGFGLATPAFVCLRLVNTATLGQMVLLFILLFLVGLSFTFITVSVMTEFAAALKEQEELNGLQRSAYG